MKEAILQAFNSSGYISDVFLVKNGEYIVLFACTGDEDSDDFDYVGVKTYLQSQYPSAAYIEINFLMPHNFLKIKELFTAY